MKISTSDPSKLHEPGNMTECVVAKCHAQDQLVLIDEALRQLRAKQRAWNKRLGVCLRKMSKIAEGKVP